MLRLELKLEEATSNWEDAAGNTLLELHCVLCMELYEMGEDGKCISVESFCICSSDSRYLSFSMLFSSFFDLYHEHLVA